MYFTHTRGSVCFDGIDVTRLLKSPSKRVLCLVSGCDEDIYADGYCVRHLGILKYIYIYIYIYIYTLLCKRRERERERSFSCCLLCPHTASSQLTFFASKPGSWCVCMYVCMCVCIQVIPGKTRFHPLGSVGRRVGLASHPAKESPNGVSPARLVITLDQPLRLDMSLVALRKTRRVIGRTIGAGERDANRAGVTAGKLGGLSLFSFVFLK